MDITDVYDNCPDQFESDNQVDWNELYEEYEREEVFELLNWHKCDHHDKAVNLDQFGHWGLYCHYCAEEGPFGQSAMGRRANWFKTRYWHHMG